MGSRRTAMSRPKYLLNICAAKKSPPLLQSDETGAAKPSRRCSKNGAPAQTILPGLREVDFGDWTGFTWKEVGEKFGVHPTTGSTKSRWGRCPTAKMASQFRARIEPCLFKIIRRHQGETAAIFCHGGVIRMLLAILLDLPLPKTNAFGIEYAGITQVALHPYLTEIELLNFTPCAIGSDETQIIPANRLQAGLFGQNLTKRKNQRWQSGQIPKNSSLWVTALKPFAAAMRDSTLRGKHSSISITSAQRVQTK